MTRDEYLRRAGEITREWNIRYADRILSAYPAFSDPHGGPDGESDYAQHHALMSATDDYADILDEQLAALTAQYHSDTTGADRA